MKTADDIERLLEEGIAESVRLLVKRVKAGEASAADIGRLKEFAREAGVTLSFNGQATPVGDDVLESLSNVDPDLLN